MTARADPPAPAWARGRRGCLAFVALWLCVAAVSLLAGLLAARGDLVVRQGELRQARLWLVSEQGNRGLGLSTARFVSRDEGAACVETRVRFLLWQSRGGPKGTRYCECYRRAGGAWELAGACPS